MAVASKVRRLGSLRYSRPGGLRYGHEFFGLKRFEKGQPGDARAESAAKWCKVCKVAQKVKHGSDEEFGLNMRESLGSGIFDWERGAGF
jgi:hypothetical protein